MLEQTTEPLLPFDLTRQRRSGRWRSLGVALYMFGNRNVAQPLMRAKGVVIANICLRDMVEVAQAEGEEMIQAFAFEAANPRPFCLNHLPLTKVQSK